MSKIEIDFNNLKYRSYEEYSDDEETIIDPITGNEYKRRKR